jgi:formate hydrogenlyase transcriptional activator
MKNAESPNKRVHSKPNHPDKGEINMLKQQLEAFEKEKNILLALSNDITKVREKDDLVKIFSSGLKGFFYFSHAVVSLVDHQKNIFYPFLMDAQTHPIKDKDIFNSLIAMRYPFTDPVFKKILDLETPQTFLLEEVLDMPGIPSFIKLNYEYGMRKVMLTPLKRKMETFGYICIYSDRTDGFQDNFKSVLKGIAPQLSNAVSNIIINDEIKHKEYVNEILLSLSNEMVTVRDKPDLLNVINFGLKKLIYFTHSVMTVLSETGETYQAFLTDPDSRARKFPEYAAMVTQPVPVGDGIYNVASRFYKPVVFDMRSFDLNSAPLWFKLNYEVGAKEMLIKILPGEEGPKHSIILFSDRENNFDEECINIVERISSQLATAASNISANEEIINKERDKSFLLEFSHDIASARTKDDLASAIYNSLKKISEIKTYFIRIINDDGTTMSPYMYNKNIFYKDDPEFIELLATKVKIKDGVTSTIMSGNIPVLIDVDEEFDRGNLEPYICFWKKVGFHKVVGTPLRTGDIDLGVLWVVTDKINMTILEGICAQISIAISNILANDQVLSYKQMLEVENDHLKEQIKTIYNFSDIIGSGPEMQKVYHMMSLVAESNSTVLLLGETGTGKELIARAIHSSSRRKNKLMVKVNCAALPASLIESELFGHEKGSFTGAIDRRVGKFELANNSTLFLDEIGEMPLETQVKLLRVIQEREFERVGGTNTIKLDVRIIAASNRNLEEEVNAGRFRSDLFYRLNVFPIVLPPLRNRLEDIAPLANFFLARYSKNTGRRVTAISSNVIKELKGYSWPGNVRELEHVIERSILLTQETVLKEIQLPQRQKKGKIEPTELSPKTLQDIERSYIIEILRKYDGKIAGSDGAAHFLEIPSTTLHSKMKKLGISKADYFPKKPEYSGH